LASLALLLADRRRDPPRRRFKDPVMQILIAAVALVGGPAFIAWALHG